MEFLTTPDLARWPSATPNSRPKPTPTQGHHPPHQTPAPLPTPSPLPTAARPPFQTPVDRAGIKNSFQALFSPNAATPALYRPGGTAPGLTPFLGPVHTPNVITPGSTLMSFAPTATSAPQQTPHHPNPTPDNPLSSPYLAAAAKEAVRREFMNMPSFVTSHDPAASPTERLVPGTRPAHPATPPSASPLHVPPPAPSPPRHVSPSSGDAKVPTSIARPRSSAVEGRKEEEPVRADAAPVEGGKEEGKEAPRAAPQQPPHQQQQQHPPGAAVPTAQGVAAGMPHVQPFFMPPGPPPPGMLMMGQHHGQMMMTAPAPGMYAPPGMVMFAGQPGFGGGMMMAPPQGHPVRQQPAVKPETQAEKKMRIEHEKQELIREFKKKTREAALVRFRQKRRERRFGKLIRYDCRKKLADARPRVKGRFVRIKEDEEDEESAQVVPGSTS